MRAFSELYEELDTTTATSLKVAAMVRYFGKAEPADAAWATYLLSGRRLKRFLGPALLYRWLIGACGLPEWLVEECRATVGDLAETIALLMQTCSPAAERCAPDVSLAAWIEERLLPLRAVPESEQQAAIIGWWRSLPYRESFLLNKFLTGELRVGVSESLVIRALAEVLELPRPDIVRRLMGNWQPSARFWESLKSGTAAAEDVSAPYPFYLASPLEADIATLGARTDWLAEWKWDGIRCQLIRRAGRCFIWSRGEDLVTERFPEIVAAASRLPDGVVLDGELVAWRDGVRPFAELQQRLGRKQVPAALQSAVPVRFLAYDVLELDQEDIRALPLAERRAHLERLLQDAPATLGLSEIVTEADWAALAQRRAEARARGVEGLMLKALSSAYGTGRQRGTWWKWKIEPHSFDAVLLYAQPGHGRRSNLYTDYTFGVWHEGALVPVAKAYSGLSNAEISALDRWIRAHTLEKFGPVRSVELSQVFELAYEGIAASARHKSGLALRFPRILRSRPDKPAAEANTLADLQGVLQAQQAHQGASKEKQLPLAAD